MKPAHSQISKPHRTYFAGVLYLRGYKVPQYRCSGCGRLFNGSPPAPSQRCK